MFSNIFYLLKNASNEPREDYLTEIFAETINENQLVKSFMKVFMSKNIEPSGLKINTQQTFNKLDWHICDSRPDIVIRFFDNQSKRENILFIECKLNAAEGNQQLKRYADHLKLLEDRGCATYLIYLTEYHDVKKEEDILDTNVDTNFIQIRWYQIYNWLKEFDSDRLVKNIITYMEEIKLNKSRNFTPQDIHVIQNIQKPLDLLEESLAGEVDDVLKEFISTGKIKIRDRYNQLVRDFKYTRQTYISDYASVEVGFWILEDDYLVASTTLWIHRDHEEYIKIEKAFDKYSKDASNNFSIDRETYGDWIGLNIDRSLLDFLSEGDHVGAIQDYFIASMKFIKEIIGNNEDINF